MATVAEVRDRAGNDLGILRLGQSLQAQDSTRITAAYNEVYAQLKKDGLAIWASTGTVPNEVVPHLAALIAENCMDTYGVSNDRAVRIKAKAGVAMPEIRKLVTSDYVSPDEPTDY